MLRINESPSFGGSLSRIPSPLLACLFEAHARFPTIPARTRSIRQQTKARLTSRQAGSVRAPSPDALKVRKIDAMPGGAAWQVDWPMNCGLPASVALKHQVKGGPGCIIWLPDSCRAGRRVRRPALMHMGAAVVSVLFSRRAVALPPIVAVEAFTCVKKRFHLLPEHSAPRQHLSTSELPLANNSYQIIKTIEAIVRASGRNNLSASDIASLNGGIILHFRKRLEDEFCRADVAWQSYITQRINHLALYVRLLTEMPATRNDKEEIFHRAISEVDAIRDVLVCAFAENPTAMPVPSRKAGSQRAERYDR